MKHEKRKESRLVVASASASQLIRKVRDDSVAPPVGP